MKMVGTSYSLIMTDIFGSFLYRRLVKDFVPHPLENVEECSG